MAGRSFETECIVEVECSAESLHAHVTLDGDIEIRPGDEVTVHGEPIRPAFGERLTLRRRATVRRAGALGYWLARLGGRFEITELFETSFSEWRRT